jgi:hypothetical protein
MEPVTFIVVVSNPALLPYCALATPFLQQGSKHTILFLPNLAPYANKNPAALLNQGIQMAATRLVVVMHDDVYLSGQFMAEMAYGVEVLDREHSDWAVAGFASNAGMQVVDIVSGDTARILSRVGPRVTSEIMFDETVMLIRKPSGVSFDHLAPNHHLQAAMLVERAGRGRSYAITQARFAHKVHPRGLTGPFSFDTSPGSPWRISASYFVRTYGADVDFPVETLNGAIQANF